MSRVPAESPIFGSSQRMNANMLATVRDMLMEYEWIRLDLKNISNPKKEPTSSEISDILANKINEIWLKASIPTVSMTRIIQLIKSHHEKYKKLLWYPASKRNGQYEQRVNDFREQATRNLFDIAACKCSNLSLCTCGKLSKVPTLEHKFLEDQRSERKMMISTVDRATTRQLQKRERRKSKYNERILKYHVNSSSAEATTHLVGCDAEGSSSTESDADIFSPDHPAETKSSIKVSTQHRHKLNNTAMACDRHAISDRAAAEIASAVLQDYGIVNSDDCSQVIDRSKIRRQRKNYRDTVCAEAASFSTSVTGIYFDGRKDKTLTTEVVDGTSHRRITVEEHISLVQEPGSIFIGHITSKRGTSSHIQSAIVSFLQKRNIDFQHLLAVGCDGTAVNTGRKGGIVRLLEEHVRRPLQWFICLLHANELPLRHLFEHIDGKTSGPRSFNGPIGVMLQKCEKMPVVSYEPIPCEFTFVTFNNLSSDQQYLLHICQAVISGHCPVSLSHRQPGKLVMSRWVTMANRVLRLYVATEQPDENLKTVAEFIVRVYAPMWFAVKSKPCCKDGSRHLFQQLKSSRYLPDRLKAIVDPVIQRNAYFGHPENILLAMLTDERAYIRKRGLRRIILARASKIHSQEVRCFEVPPLNFNAEEYFDMVDWEECVLTEPPVTQSISDEELQSFVHSCQSAIVEFPRFPCHTQAVERCVKAVTEASTAVVGPEARDGFIRARIQSRSNMPTFETKANYRSSQ
jgi:hypothetical protein